MNIKEYIKEQRLITDGAMGTYYEEKYSEDTVIAEFRISACGSKADPHQYICSKYHVSCRYAGSKRDSPGGL